MKILVLGGSGLVGSRIRERIGGTHAVDFPSRQQLDLSDPASIRRVPDVYEVVVHCAQSRNYSTPALNQSHFKTMNLINGGCLNLLLNQCKKIRRVIYLSSGGLYKASQRELNEDSPLEDFSNLSPHFQGKLLTEQFLNTLAEQIEVCVLRLFTVYGKEANLNTLMPRIHKQLLRGETIKVSAAGGDLLRPTHVIDVVNCVEKLVNNRLIGTFNLGGPEILTFRTLAFRISKEYGLMPQFSENGQAQRVIAPSNFAIQKELYSPKFIFSGNWQV